MKDKVDMIVDGLAKSFPRVWANKYSDMTEFCCKVDDSRLCYIFPVTTRQLKENNPYDIVNAIWEYILRYVFVS